MPRRSFLQLAAEASPVGIFILMGLGLFHRLFFSGHVLFFRDFFRYFYPARQVSLELLRTEGLDAWNPYTDAGLPLLADLSHVFLLYPPNALFLAGDALTVFNVLTLGHFVLAAGGMYALFLRVRPCRLGAITAATAFILSGFALSTLDRVGFFYTMSWLPWVVLAWDRATIGRLRTVLGLAGVSLVQLLAGEVQIVLLSHLLGIVFFLRGPVAASRIRNACSGTCAR